MNYCDDCGPNSGKCFLTGVCQHKATPAPFYSEVSPAATDKPAPPAPKARTPRKAG